jgi:hypothetical protein
VQRIAKGPVVFDLVVQIAEKGDKVEDPSIAWPDSRKTVKLGTFSQCPLYPQKRTLIERVRMSALCHKRTHAVQQKPS